MAEIVSQRLFDDARGCYSALLAEAGGATESKTPAYQIADRTLNGVTSKTVRRPAAIKLLKEAGLVSCRSGRSGGYILHKPEVRELTLTYLRNNGYETSGLVEPESEESKSTSEARESSNEPTQDSNLGATDEPLLHYLRPQGVEARFNAGASLDEQCAQVLKALRRIDSRLVRWPEGYDHSWFGMLDMLAVYMEVSCSSESFFVLIDALKTLRRLELVDLSDELVGFTVDSRVTDVQLAARVNGLSITAQSEAERELRKLLADTMRKIDALEASNRRLEADVARLRSGDKRTGLMAELAEHYKNMLDKVMQSL